MFRYLILCLSLTLATALPAEGEERLKIGLALSGGGARGAAHIGVLQELERLKVPIDYIAGTSIGAIIGAAYASGMSTAEIQKTMVDTNWDDIFDDQPPRKDRSIRRKFDDRIFQINNEIGLSGGKLKLPSGVVQGQKLQLLLDKLFVPVADVQNFNQLPTPFRAVATDIATSRPVVLDSGSLSTAVRASMSVPTVFATVNIDDHILVDGGISNNLPVDVVRGMGANIVIAVDIGSPLLGAEELESAIGVTVQLTNILVRRTTDAQIATLTERDILITPELADFSAADFKNSVSIIPNGAEATSAVADKLAPLSVTQSEYGQHQVARDIKQNAYPIVAFIKIENDSALSDAYLLSKLRQKLGEKLDFEQLEEDIGLLYGLEIFQTINYNVVEENGETGLVVNARQKPWGPNYLQFGLRYSSDLVDNNNLGLTLGYTITPLNIWNGEWRSILQLGEEPGVATELNQPLGIGSPYYVNGSVAWSNERFNIFLDGSKIAQIRAKKLGATGAVGREFGNWGDLRAGLNRFFSNNSFEIGQPDDDVSDADGGEFFVRFRIDTLDDAFFPTRGANGFVQWLSSRAALGADTEFDQALVDLTGAATFGSHTFFLGGRYYTTFKGTAPIQNNFRLGGLFELPGFVENELSGQDLYLLRVAYQRKIASLFNTSPYLGLTLQHGQVFRNEEDINLADGITAGGVWLGWNSFVGPIYLGYGWAETGNQSVYMIIGSPF